MDYKKYTKVVENIFPYKLLSMLPLSFFWIQILMIEKRNQDKLQTFVDTTAGD